jgi:hypothetical protein
MVYSVAMLGLILGASSLGVLALLLASALRGKFFARYLFFYAYLLTWLAVGSLRLVFFAFHLDSPDEYGLVYWYTQFLLVAGGYAVVWQIYSHTLRSYPGTAKMARVLVSSVYAVVLMEVFFYVLAGHSEDLTGSIIRLERNLQGIQAVLLILFSTLVWYYGIPLRRNVQGLLLGYGLLVVTRLITLTFRSVLGTDFYSWWYYSEPICIFATLLIWFVGFRSYYPNPAPECEVELESDYKMATQRTLEALGRARGYLARAFLQ